MTNVYTLIAHNLIKYRIYIIQRVNSHPNPDKSLQDSRPSYSGNTIRNTVRR